MRVVGVGRADDGRADQLVFTIAADVSFVAVVALAVFARVAGVGIGSLTGARRLGIRPFAAGLHQGRIHQCGAFDDVTACFQLRVEQVQQLLMQTAFDESLAKPADGGFIRHRFVRVELHKSLEAQPVVELFFSLRIAQSIKVLQNHDAQQDA